MSTLKQRLLKIVEKRYKVVSKILIIVRKLRSVGSVVEWLKHRTDDQHGLGSKPTRAILLCSWERHFTALSPAWWSWQAILYYINISTTILHYQRTAISWHLRKQVWVIAYPMYSASVAFLRTRRIKIEIKKKRSTDIVNRQRCRALRLQGAMLQTYKLKNQLSTSLLFE